MPHHELVVGCIMALFNIEGSVPLDAMLGDRPRIFSPQVQRLNDLSQPPDVAACLGLQQGRQLVSRDYQAAFLEADVVVLPVAPIPAPRLDAEEMRDAARCSAYTGAANLNGMPAVPLPAGTSGGLPVAVQILAPLGADALALRVAYTLEQAAPEHRVHPPPLGA